AGESGAGDVQRQGVAAVRGRYAGQAAGMGELVEAGDGNPGIFGHVRHISGCLRKSHAATLAQCRAIGYGCPAPETLRIRKGLPMSEEFDMAPGLETGIDKDAFRNAEGRISALWLE